MSTNASFTPPSLLFAGPTQHLLNTLVQNIGDYLGALLTKSFDVYAYVAQRLLTLLSPAQQNLLTEDIGAPQALHDPAA